MCLTRSSTTCTRSTGTSALRVTGLSKLLYCRELLPADPRRYAREPLPSRSRHALRMSPIRCLIVLWPVLLDKSQANPAESCMHRARFKADT